MLPAIRMLPVLCGAALAVSVVACTYAAHHAAPEARTRVRYSQLPARLCLALNAQTAAATARGDTRLWVQLRNRTPALRHSPAFHLVLIERGARRSLEPFGMQVDPVEAGRAGPQRFIFDLRDAGLAADSTGRVCFEIERDADAGAPQDMDAELEIAMRWQSVLPTARRPQLP
jgi:hypothetical protein